MKFTGFQTFGLKSDISYKITAEIYDKILVNLLFFSFYTNRWLYINFTVKSQQQAKILNYHTDLDKCRKWNVYAPFKPNNNVYI